MSDPEAMMHALLQRAFKDPTSVRGDDIGDLYMCVQICRRSLDPQFEPLFSDEHRKRAAEMLVKLRAIFRSEHVQNLGKTEEQRAFLRNIVSD